MKLKTVCWWCQLLTVKSPLTVNPRDWSGSNYCWCYRQSSPISVNVWSLTGNCPPHTITPTDPDSTRYHHLSWFSKLLNNQNKLIWNKISEVNRFSDSDNLIRKIIDRPEDFSVFFTTKSKNKTLGWNKYLSQEMCFSRRGPTRRQSLILIFRHMRPLYAI